MNEMESERLRKLPKWAQEKISKLTNDLQTAQSRLSVAFEANNANPLRSGNVRIESYAHETPGALNLPDNTPIRFKTRTGPLSIHLSTKGDLEVYGLMGGPLHILPAASNHITVHGDYGDAKVPEDYKFRPVT